MQVSSTKPEKENLLNSYRDALHDIATAETLLELDGSSFIAVQIIKQLSDYKFITLKDENDMKTTVSVFSRKTAKKILEED